MLGSGRQAGCVEAAPVQARERRRRARRLLPASVPIGWKGSMPACRQASQSPGWQL